MALGRSHPTPGSACQGSGASRVEGRGKVICVCGWRVVSIELEVPRSSLLSLFSSEMCQGPCLSPPTQLTVPSRIFCAAGASWPHGRGERVRTEPRLFSFCAEAPSHCSGQSPVTRSIPMPVGQEHLSLRDGPSREGQ